MSKTTFLTDELLDHVYRNLAFTSPTTVYAGLLTAVADKEAGSVTEANYTGYGRVAITFGAPGAGLNGRQVANSAAVTFGQNTGSLQTMIAVGIYDAISAGNLMFIIFLDGGNPEIGVVSDLVGNNIEVPSTAFVNDDRCRLEAIPGSGSIPAGLSENTTYWVVGATADTIQLSLTQGGAAIDITADGGMIIYPLTPKDVGTNDTPEFAIGALVVAED